MPGQDGRCAYRVGCHGRCTLLLRERAPAACARRTLRAPRWTLLHTCGGNTFYRVASWHTVLHHGALSCNMRCATTNPFPVTVRKGWGERSPGADVAGGAQSLVRMGQRRAQSRCRCGTRPSAGTRASSSPRRTRTSPLRAGCTWRLRVGPVPVQMWEGASPSPGADRGGVSPACAQKRQRCAQSRSRFASLVEVQMWKGEPGPGADVAAVRPVPEQTWQGRARSRCPSVPGPHVVQHVPALRDQEFTVRIAEVPNDRRLVLQQHPLP